MWKGRAKRRKMGITNVGQKSEAEKKAAVFKLDSIKSSLLHCIIELPFFFLWSKSSFFFFDDDDDDDILFPKTNKFR